MSGRCADKPFGCGEPVTPFTSTVATREYRISGLCERCQTAVFGESDDEDDDPDETEFDAEFYDSAADQAKAEAEFSASMDENESDPDNWSRPDLYS